MIRRALVPLVWMCAGHAIAIALFVALVNVQDATVGMLVVSALLVVAGLIVVAVTDATAVPWLFPGFGFRQAIGLGLRRGVPALALGLATYCGFWFGASWLDSWHQAHTGEIDAWWMATLNSEQTIWIHRTIQTLLFVARGIVATSIALALGCSVLLRGTRSAWSTRWLSAAFSRLLLGTVALASILCFVLPWRAVAWRPSGLPATWVEPVFVGVKVALIYVVIHVGWTAMLAVAGRVTASLTPVREWTA